MIALFPGSFHPPTVGHKDIIARAAAMFEKVYVAVMVNAEKTYVMSAEERVEMLKKMTACFSNVEVVSSAGLTADLARSLNAGVLVRGLRGTDDFEYEDRIAQVNRMLTGIDTVFLPSLPEHRCVSSTVVNDIARHGGAFETMIPQEILNDFRRVLSRRSKECNK